MLAKFAQFLKPSETRSLKQENDRTNIYNMKYDIFPQNGSFTETVETYFFMYN